MKKALWWAADERPTAEQYWQLEVLGLIIVMYGVITPYMAPELIENRIQKVQSVFTTDPCLAVYAAKRGKTIVTAVYGQKPDGQKIFETFQVVEP